MIGEYGFEQRLVAFRLKPVYLEGIVDVVGRYPRDAWSGTRPRTVDARIVDSPLFDRGLKRRPRAAGVVSSHETYLRLHEHETSPSGSDSLCVVAREEAREKRRDPDSDQ